MKFETIKLLKEHPDTALLKDDSRLMETNKMLRNKIKNFKIPDAGNYGNVSKVNLMLFGNMGAGKSSFLNSSMSALSESYIQRAAVGSSGNNHTTTTITKNRLIEENPYIYIWDTFGWSAEGKCNYQNIFLKILDGQVNNKFNMKECKENSFNSNAQFEDRVHAIIIPVEVSVATEDECKVLKEFYQTLCQNNITPIIALTKIDRLEQCNLTKQIELDNGCEDKWVQDVLNKNTYYKINELEPVISRINLLAKNTGIPKTNIYPVVNYTGGSSFPNEHLTYFNLKVLMAALENAASFIKQYNLEISESFSNYPLTDSKIRNMNNVVDIFTLLNIENNKFIGALKIQGENSLAQVREYLKLKKIKTPESFGFCKRNGECCNDEKVLIKMIANQKKEIFLKAKGKILKDSVDK